MLLDNPPSGIEYVFYKDLFRNGAARRPRLISKVLWQLRRRKVLSPDTWVEFFDTDLSFDLVHVHGYSVWFSQRFRRTLRRRSTPIVMSTSSMDVYDLLGYLGWSEQRTRLAFAVKKPIFKTLGIYDHHVNFPRGSIQLVWSEFARKLHESWASPKETAVIPPCVELPSLPNGRRGGRCKLLFVGSEFERKGGNTLLDAYREAKQVVSDIELWIVGPPKLTLKKDIPEVTHIPWVTRERLQEEILPEANVFILPSHAEGYGLSVLEAMAHETPVIVSSVGAFPEIVRDGVDGCVVPPARVRPLRDAIVALASDPGRRTAMGKAARNRVQQNFSIEMFQTRLGEVYQAALRQPTRLPHQDR
jgi:glycosyltransferase involved in cell wall biosynthesis